MALHRVIVSLVYGLLLLLIPTWMFALSQDPGAPAGPGWVRWSGGLLIGVGVAAGLAAANPETQKPLVVGLVVATALIALSLLYSLFVEPYGGVQWFLWMPILINAALAVALGWVSTKQTRGLSPIGLAILLGRQLQVGRGFWCRLGMGERTQHVAV